MHIIAVVLCLCQLKCDMRNYLLSVKRPAIFAGLIILLVLITAGSLGIGNYRVSPGRTLHIMKDWICGQDVSETGDYASVVIVQMRVPRIIMVILVGLTLGMSGCVSQGFFRNPLVSPFILGISAGASLGAAFAIVFFSSTPFSLDLMAAVGGFAAVVLAYIIARTSKGNIPRLSLILSGIIVSSFCSALVGILKYIADTETQLPAITFWMMGGFGAISWDSVYPGIYIIPAALLLMLISSWQLNVMSMGDREASSLGMNVERWKILLIILVVVSVGSSVSRSGIIGWLGLIVPHIARVMVGPDHRYSLPASGLLGAILLLISDDLARTITTGEIPIGIITAIIGTPLFVIIMRNKRKELWGNH